MSRQQYTWRKSFDEHLRSINDIIDWALRHLVVDTRKWLLGKHILVIAELIGRIIGRSLVFLEMTREAMATSAEFGLA